MFNINFTDNICDVHVDLAEPFDHEVFFERAESDSYVLCGH